MTVRSARLWLALTVEALWSFAAVAVCVRLFGGGTGPAPSAVAVAAVVVMSFGMARVMQGTDVDESQLRAIAVIASVIVLLVIVQLEYAPSVPPWRLGWVRDLLVEPRALLAGHGHVAAATVALTLLWLRGVVRGRAPLEFGDVLSSATLGLAAIAIAAVASPPVHGSSAFGPLAVLYFVLTLCTLALYQTGDPSESIAAFASRWAVAFSLLVGGAALLTVVAAAIDPKSLGFLAFLGRPLVIGLEQLAIYVFGPILGGIAYLFGLIPFHPHQMKQQPQPQLPAAPVTKADGDTPMWFEVAGYVLAGGGLLLLVLAFAAAIWFAIRRFARRTPSVVEQRRGVERDSLLGEDLAALFDGIARRLRRTASPRSSVEVRRLYHEMLARAEADGLARPPSATPLQFAPDLDSRYGSEVPSSISRAFVASRYGLVDFDERVVRDLRARWSAVADRS
ncbi:MAG: DUF4129 domain-containing protein [Chloroflexota bacterium]|nr:DUF4129 domain-containing protein [Chloroflexota bacterium]